jgi:hypothetical protein
VVDEGEEEWAQEWGRISSGIMESDDAARRVGQLVQPLGVRAHHQHLPEQQQQQQQQQPEPPEQHLELWEQQEQQDRQQGLVANGHSALLEGVPPASAAALISRLNRHSEALLEADPGVEARGAERLGSLHRQLAAAAAGGAAPSARAPDALGAAALGKAALGELGAGGSGGGASGADGGVVGSAGALAEGGAEGGRAPGQPSAQAELVGRPPSQQQQQQQGVVTGIRAPRVSEDDFSFVLEAPAAAEATLAKAASSRPLLPNARVAVRAAGPHLQDLPGQEDGSFYAPTVADDHPGGGAAVGPSAEVEPALALAPVQEAAAADGVGEGGHAEVERWSTERQQAQLGKKDEEQQEQQQPEQQQQEQQQQEQQQEKQQEKQQEQQQQQVQQEQQPLEQQGEQPFKAAARKRVRFAPRSAAPQPAAEAQVLGGSESSAAAAPDSPPTSARQPQAQHTADAEVTDAIEPHSQQQQPQQLLLPMPQAEVPKSAAVPAQQQQHPPQPQQQQQQQQQAPPPQIDLEAELEALDAQDASLRAQQRKAARSAEAPTADMYAECQELLRLFGLPYIVAPVEAEAQCAWLEGAGLVDGTVTDDNDVFLFGGRHVYRHLFDDKK